MSANPIPDEAPMTTAFSDIAFATIQRTGKMIKFPATVNGLLKILRMLLGKIAEFASQAAQNAKSCTGGFLAGLRHMLDAGKLRLPDSELQAQAAGRVC